MLINRCGGGSGKSATTVDIFNFPCVFSLAAPESPKPNTLWINRAGCADINNMVLDSAVRVSYTDGYIMLIVDNNNNASDNFSQTKTINGKSIAFAAHRESTSADALPWEIGDTKNDAITLFRKYPLVYSRLAGVLDMETAEIWDGAHWIQISQKGSYLLFDDGASPYVEIYNRTGQNFTKHADLPTIPNGQCKWILPSPDGQYLFVTLNSSYSPCGYMYKRTGDVFTQLSMSIDNAIVSAAWSNDMTYIALCEGSNVYIYKRNADTFTKIATVAGSISNTDIAFSYNGLYLIVCDATQGNKIYVRNGDTFTACSTSGLPALLSSISFTSSYYFGYNTTGLYFGKIKADGSYMPLTAPSALPDTPESKITFSHDETYALIGIRSSPYCYAYKRTGDTISFVTTITGLSAEVTGISFTLDDSLIAIMDESNYVKIYTHSGDTFTFLKSISLKSGNPTYTAKCAFIG